MAPADLSLRTLAASRIAVGAALLIAPLSTSGVFLIPATSASTFATQLAGARDFAVGGLLWHSLRRSPVTTELKDSTQPQLKATPNFENGAMLRAAVMTGLVVDSIDLMSCLACFLQGLLPVDGALMFAGGASVFVALGAWGWVKLGK